MICRGLGRESSDAAGQAPDGGPDVNPGCASAGGAAEALSCESGGLGLTTCGSSQHDCCCTSLEVVPNGSFYRSYENAGSGLAAEADPATVSGFRLDKYLVTVGRVRQFVAAWSGGWSTAPGSGKHAHLSAGRGLADSSAPGSYETGWDGQWDSMVAPSDANLICGSGNDTWTPSAASNESLPINCTTWYEAYAFCIWDGGFLPSESEWEYAAAGGGEQRAYPWGSTDPGADNLYAIYGCHYGAASSCKIAPVGIAPLGAGLWQQLDLAGELFEWTLDWYAPYVDPCSDCAYLAHGSYRVSRGGVFNTMASSLTPPYRGYFNTPWIRYGNVGVRCARTP